MKFMCMVAIFLITSTMLGADFFKELVNPFIHSLEDRIKLLPDEIQLKIYYMVIADVNKAMIKNYIQESVKICRHKQDWYDVEHYFAFRKYGSECTHIVAFYAKKGKARYSGIGNFEGLRRASGSCANIFLHSLKNETVSTIDLESHRVAPSCYNSINLCQRDKNSDQAYVFWLHKSSCNASYIMEKDYTCAIL